VKQIKIDGDIDLMDLLSEIEHMSALGACPFIVSYHKSYLTSKEEKYDNNILDGNDDCFSPATPGTTPRVIPYIHTTHLVLKALLYSWEHTHPEHKAYS